MDIRRGGAASWIRAEMRAGKEVRFYMVTYEGLFQFSLVLLTALLVAAAFHGRKK